MLSGAVKRYPAKVKEECGVFGIYNHAQSAYFTYLGLFALQHRGHESAGITVSNGNRLQIKKGMGLVENVFTEEDFVKLKGNSAIGHVRYSTTGDTTLANAQPLFFKSWRGEMALAHNGNLVNSLQLRAHLEKLGAIFQTTADTEVIAHLLAREGEENLITALKQTLSKVKGAYSLVILTPERLIGVRDPHGFRPLVLGQKGDSFILASESSAFDLIGAELIRDVRPGEIVIIEDQGIKSESLVPSKDEVREAFCSFEYVYLARPDSIILGQTVHSVRERLGAFLAKRVERGGDLVIPVPDSGIFAARGFAREKGLPWNLGLIKNRYVARTFIQPQQADRDFKVRLKLNPVKELITGKDIYVIDDSIVRGTTSRHIIRLLKNMGAGKVHFCSAAPPVVYPCFYGLDTSDRKELLAAKLKPEQIREKIGADSLYYLNIEDLKRAINLPGRLCTACFDGRYPTEGSDQIEEDQLQGCRS